jgi:hypothetical protein
MSAVAPLENPDWQSYLVNENSREYTDDKTWAGFVVDIAVLQQDINTITKPDAYIVNLNPLYLSYSGFKALFYAEGSAFSPTLNLSNVLKHKIGSQYVLNSNRTYSVLPTDCGQCQLQLDGSLNLLKALLQAYETDLKISTECWDTCSLMEFYNTIDAIKALTDITGDCGSGVKCSLTLDDFFNQLEMQGMKMGGAPTYLPVDPSSVDISFNGQQSIYPGLVTAVITANFHSTTPGVKDVQVRWPYIINFTSIVSNDINGNTIYASKSSGIIDSSFSNPLDASYNGGVYPVYLYVNNDTTGAYRSPDLSYNTVDISNNIFFATTANSNSIPEFTGPGTNPNYTRYTAQKFSKIYYETSVKY